MTADHQTPTDETCVFTLTGEVDAANFTALADAGRNVIAERGDAKQLIIDLSGVTFIDSSGLGMLVDVRAVAVAVGLTVQLRGASERIRRVLDMSGLAELFGLGTPGPAADVSEADADG